MTAGGPSHAERVAWLRLARTPGIGPVGFSRLLDHYDTALDALDALPDRLRRAGRPPPRIPGRETAEAEMDAAQRAGVRLLIACEAEYPVALSVIPAPPPVLLVRGELDLLDRPCCALVGARNASVAGLRFAREIAWELGGHGVTVASGLARGIDGAAHAGALETGTVAVLAGGLDHVYPPEHGALHADIAERGLLVSEVPLGTVPTARDFPRRNRLISGLCLGTLVIEAAMRSGSLITARFAAEQGREVMAVPGSPLDPRARGSNRLLRDGAHLVESAEDVMDILSGARLPAREGLSDTTSTYADATYDDWFCEDEEDRSAIAVPPEQPLLPDECPDVPGDAGTRLRDLLSPVPVSADELARQAALPVGQVQALLIEMELSGDVARLPGGLIQRSSSSR